MALLIAVLLAALAVPTSAQALTTRRAERAARHYVLRVDQDAYYAKARCELRRQGKAVCSAVSIGDSTCYWLLGVFERPSGLLVHRFYKNCE